MPTRISADILNANRIKNDTNPSKEIRRSSAWAWLSRVIVGAGVVWVVIVFARDFATLRNDFRIESFGWLGFTFVVGILALLLTVPIFQLLLGSHSGSRIRYTDVARLFFAAQVLRHLPGRVWGVIYLIAETRPSIPASAMVRANIDFMFFSLSFNVLVAILLYAGVTGGLVVAGAIGVPVVVLLAAAAHYDWIGRVVRSLSKLLPQRGSKYSAGLAAHRPLPWNRVIKIIVCYTLSWGCYLLFWWALTGVFAVLGDVNIWLVCAAYSVAWVLGYLAMITPAGLGVREAGFFAMAAPLMSLPNLTVLAIFIRVWQVVTELLVFSIFALIKPRGATDSTLATNDSS